jgi:3-oxo-5alpha-steroid 4-dehydrogenase
MAKKEETDDGTPSRVRRAADVTSWDREFDVVVVGMGSAGCCAAIEAADAGASVIVLERAGSGGGTSAMAGGQVYMGAGTPLQKGLGFDDDVEEMFKYLVASCGPQADEEKIRLYCEESVAHYDWLTEGQGVPFKMSYLGPEITTDPHTDDGLTWTGSELAYPFNEIAKPAPRGHTVQQEGGNAGLLLMEKLMASCEAKGVEMQTLALTQALVQRGEDHSVVGVVARVEGEETLIRARKGVILCAGGFIRNRAMIERYAPHLLKVKARVAAAGDDGYGIRLGLGAGGEAIRMDAAMIALPYSPPRQLLYGVMVNKQGLRYINEDVYQSNHGEISILRQNGEIYLIVDDATFVRPEVPFEIAAVGETYEELESELGMPRDSLSHTMAGYNEHAAKGEDPYFHKAPEWLKPLDNPPYAAFDLTYQNALYAAFTLGGLRTRPTGEVLTPDSEIIPGLYAAGRNASGLPAFGYNSGLSLADSTWTGRKAGVACAATDAT